MNDERLVTEIAGNYDQFQRKLAQYLKTDRNRFALLRRGDVIGLFDTPSAADLAGADQFPDRVYSIQKVTDEPVEFGIYANAIH